MNQLSLLLRIGGVHTVLWGVWGFRIFWGAYDHVSYQVRPCRVRFIVFDLGFRVENKVLQCGAEKFGFGVSRQVCMMMFM